MRDVWCGTHSHIVTIVHTSPLLELAKFRGRYSKDALEREWAVKASHGLLKGFVEGGLYLLNVG